MLYELTEAFRIAFQVIRAHKMRSILTALGVIIGIIAVTLMGSAISGLARFHGSSSLSKPTKTGGKPCRSVPQVLGTHRTRPYHRSLLTRC